VQYFARSSQPINSIAKVPRLPATNPQNIGIVGGLGVGATVIYYQKITAACAARGIVPRLTIVHANAPTALALVTAGDIDGLARYLAGFTDALCAAGCDLLVIPAITPHICRAQLKPRLRAPLLDLLDVTSARVRERGLKRIALFGTRFTIEQRMFGALDAFDLVTPQPAEIDEIHRVYLELAQHGRTAPENVDRLRDIARTLVTRERVESILLAGTDLNIVLNEQSAGFPALDCAQAHIDAIVERMAATGA
jgi:aspartate racemase